MVLPPLSTFLIAAGLVLFSIMLVDKARAGGMVRRSTTVALVVCAALLLGGGLTIHLSAPVSTGFVEARQPPRSVQAKWAFAFEPKEVLWGGEVFLRVTPACDDFTVYFNGRPLPKKIVDEETVSVTIPANSKSGFFTLDFRGTRVEAGEQLTVTMQ